MRGEVVGEPILVVERLEKAFTLHVQGGVVLNVLAGVSFSVAAGECLALEGPSGAGKSTVIRCLYGNYRPQGGAIRVRHADAMVDLAVAPPRDILAVRRRTIGYVSQFLRVVPRVPAIDVVAEPLLALGHGEGAARAKAGQLLSRLNIPERLWSLAPATFSGGEQQRINIARVFVTDFPVLLLDEPTASLDAANRAEVVALIREAKGRGAAIVGIFHDRSVREAVADRSLVLTPLTAASPAAVGS
jgi:alpha-D-ribose 1-methylphosphonate 5-triphosphate synthase subunit PhnL